MIIPCEKLFLAFVCSSGWIAGGLIEECLLALIQQICISMKVADSLCVKTGLLQSLTLFYTYKCPDSH